MPAPSRFSPQDWEATLVACHYHPKHVKELMKLRDDMHDYEMHVHRLATDPHHTVPDPPNVTMRMGQILGDSVAQFSQSRETSFHDGKRPGEFAPSQGGKVALPLEPFPKSFQELQSRDYVDVFHGTTIQRLEKMLARGGSRKGDRGQFLITPDFTHASQYPEFPGDDEDPVVIAVRVPVSALMPDENDNPGISLEDSLFSQPYTSAADVHGGITFSQIRGVFGSSPEDPFTADETGPEIAAAIMGKSHEFSRDESPLDLACRLSGISPADVVESLSSEFSRQLDGIGPVEFGQKSFDWDETAVHRETSAHDGKKPGEFAPKQGGLSASHFKTISDDTKNLPPLLEFISKHSGKDGPVPKKDFETAKKSLSNLADNWGNMLWPYSHVKSENRIPESMYDATSAYGVPSVIAMSGRVEKLKSDHPAAKLAIDFSADIRKLRDELEAIKPRIATAAQQRETTKVEKKQKEQMAPVTKLSEAISTATESIKPQLQSLYGDWMKHRVEGVNRIRANFEKARAIPASERTPDQASSVRSLFKYYREELSQVQHVLKPSSSSLREDSDSELDAEKVEKHAKQYASDTADAMRSKINQKLVDVEDPSFLNAGNNTFILNGTRGGKKIRIEQSFKWNTSVLGNSFVQFPALIYVDGKSVSESKYKSMFKPEPESEPKPLEPEKPKGSAQSFISAVREMGYKNPFANETVVGNAAVELHASPDGSVWLKSIRALTPKKGDGSAMLKQLTKLADENGVEIKGEAVPFGKSMSAAKLKKWYVAHGFTMNGEEFTYTPTPRLKIGSGPMRSIPIEQPEQE